MQFGTKGTKQISSSQMPDGKRQCLGEPSLYIQLELGNQKNSCNKIKVPVNDNARNNSHKQKYHGSKHSFLLPCHETKDVKYIVLHVR